MAIKTQLSDDGKILTIAVTGRLDIMSHGDFTQAYATGIDSVAKWIVDMSATEYIDSSALGMLLILREKAGGDKADITLLNPNPDVRKTLRTVTFDKFFKIE
ncbi:MAG: STAS domain-containing protein [Deltaproteobacteria bacterium]|nr:STAS domain-containing protein [Deltaproteobacteria bacterium]